MRKTAVILLHRETIGKLDIAATGEPCHVINRAVIEAISARAQEAPPCFPCESVLCDAKFVARSKRQSFRLMELEFLRSTRGRETVFPSLRVTSTPSASAPETVTRSPRVKPWAFWWNCTTIPGPYSRASPRRAALP